MSTWVNCEDCGYRHRQGACSAGAVRPVAARSDDRLGRAARELIDAAHDAARARLAHELHLASARQRLSPEERFGIAQARRTAEAEAMTKLERYIEAAKTSLQSSGPK